MSSAARGFFAHHDMAAQTASQQAVTEGTHQKRSRLWRWYLEFLMWIELAHNPFLDGIPPHHQRRIIRAYLNAYRVGRFSSTLDPGTRTLGTVRDALDAVVETFRANQRESPAHDRTGGLDFLFQRLFKGYKNDDPSVKPQKALTPSLIRKMSNLCQSNLDTACTQLVTGAFFFAMRSCEYSSVSGPKRRTKLLCIRNIQFYRNHQRLRHDDPNLGLADCIAITFEFQKNDQRDETVIQYRSGDPLLCPVRSWSAIVQRILGFTGTTQDSPVNLYLTPDGTIHCVSSTDVLDRLCLTARLMGEGQLGLQDKEIGTHSIQSGAAMAMYLSGVPAFVIMMIGRWSSDAFLRYIRRQVQEFSYGISSKMLLSNEFFAIPSARSNDPRTSGASNNFSGRGLPLGLTAQSHSNQPAFSLHH